MRQSLSDELDQLAELAAPHVDSPIALANYLFATQKLSGNRANPLNPKNSDLAWSIAQGESNPLGLSLIFMLVGHRLSLPVFGCNYPGHFLALIDHEGQPTLIDCFHNARPTPVKDLLGNHPELSEDARVALREPCTLLAMLSRLLRNLNLAFAQRNRNEDAKLISQLIRTIDPL
jgi:regulator of sirC expression with transglutaminase-like and TPR domain